MKLSGDFLFGDGMAAQARYSGLVDKVEVAFVTEEQTLQWPFRLTDLSMAGKPAGIVRDTTPDFRPYTVQALRRDVPRANPFELSFDRAQAFFTTRLDFTLRSPALPNFERAFTVGRLQLERIELKDGTTLTPGQHAEAGGMSVTVTARGRRSLTLRTDTGGERILYVRLTDADGRPVVSFSPNIMETPDGAWRFELAPQGAPAHAEVIFAGDLERKAYPFRLEPNPSRP